MKTWMKIGIIVFAQLIELLLVNMVNVDAVKPDLVMITIICLSFLYGSKDGIIIGFIGGLLKDVFSVNLLGTNALVKTVIGYISGIIREKIFQQHLVWIVTIATFVLTILNNTFVYYLLGIFHANYDFIEIFRKYSVNHALINSILAPFIFISIRKLSVYIQR
ncbi:MAG: rod shape-determining protein MreD [Candidatus Atribacteria bacterium]|nr:rod shape-determining protein MreD [Candidatus Atribacteria bacterium]